MLVPDLCYRNSAAVLMRARFRCTGTGAPRLLRPPHRSTTPRSRTAPARPSEDGVEAEDQIWSWSGAQTKTTVATTKRREQTRNRWRMLTTHPNSASLVLRRRRFASSLSGSPALGDGRQTGDLRGPRHFTEMMRSGWSVIRLSGRGFVESCNIGRSEPETQNWMREIQKRAPGRATGIKAKTQTQHQGEEQKRASKKSVTAGGGGAEDTHVIGEAGVFEDAGEGEVLRGRVSDAEKGGRRARGATYATAPLVRAADRRGA
ncbi:hypothetical protein C8R45DRAFT_924155 [Mycena sanguinolenta]|nr:hypothetical protein C8R45DRAFT_924155 [Mycena sanguinolenta]